MTVGAQGCKSPVGLSFGGDTEPRRAADELQDLQNQPRLP